MRKLRPSNALLAYLDYELEGRSAPPLQPPSAAPANRRALRRAAVAAFALAFALAGIGIASLALAQDAGVCREPDAGTECEAAPYSCCSFADPVPFEPPPEPPVVIARAGTSRGGNFVLGLAGGFLLLVAFGVVLVPDAARRFRERRDHRARALRMAIESRRGGRRSNEDRSAAFSVDEYDVLVAADGMGGHIGGARAASIVVASVQEYLEDRLALARDIELATDLVRSAFVRAAEALAAEDEEMGLGKRGVDALRSTLIVAVVNADSYVVGAQGDGGAWVQRGSGITIPLMTAAKGEAANIVTASLGPAPEGTVEIMKKRRMPRDVLVICTDGVADRVGPEFDQAIRAHADEATDAREIVRPILDEFEKRPAVFDDNLTLGLLVTP